MFPDKKVFDSTLCISTKRSADFLLSVTIKNII